jgi:hypothetical protein
VIGRREAIAVVALVPLFPSAASACMVQTRLPELKFNRQLQRRRVETVRSLFQELHRASSEIGETEKRIARYVRTGFSLPARPVPFELKSAAAFGDLVLVRAQGFLSTLDSECNPVVVVNAYYACIFDGEQVAVMDTITYG